MPAEPQPPRQQQQHQDSVFVAQEAPAPVALPPQAAPPPPAQSTTTYVALYDYTAADTDEVNFDLLFIMCSPSPAFLGTDFSESFYQ